MSDPNQQPPNDETSMVGGQGEQAGRGTTADGAPEPSIQQVLALLQQAKQKVASLQLENAALKEQAKLFGADALGSFDCTPGYFQSLVRSYGLAAPVGQDYSQLTLKKGHFGKLLQVEDAWTSVSLLLRRYRMIWLSRKVCLTTDETLYTTFLFPIEATLSNFGLCSLKADSGRSVYVVGFGTDEAEVADVGDAQVGLGLKRTFRLLGQKPRDSVSLGGFIPFTTDPLEWFLDANSSHQVLKLCNMFVKTVHCRILSEFRANGRLSVEDCVFEDNGLAFFELIRLGIGPKHFCITCKWDLFLDLFFDPPQDDVLVFPSQALRDALVETPSLTGKLGILGSYEGAAFQFDIPVLSEGIRLNRTVPEVELINVAGTEGEWSTVLASLSGHPTLKKLVLRCHVDERFDGGFGDAAEDLARREQVILHLLESNQALVELDIDDDMVGREFVRSELAPRLKMNRFRPRIHALKTVDDASVRHVNAIALLSDPEVNVDLNLIYMVASAIPEDLATRNGR